MSQDELCQQASAVQISQGQILNITLLASVWKSTAGGLSTLIRELAINLSQIQNVRVSLLVPEGACNDEDKMEARSFGISILDAKKCVGLDPLVWLSYPPQDHKIDVIVGHGVKLGCQVLLIKRQPQFQNCKWVHVVHTAPEDQSKYKDYINPISKGEKKLWDEVDLCKYADLVVLVGPKLRKAYHWYLQKIKKDEDFFELIPGLFEREFADLCAKRNPKDERDDFIVLLCGRGDEEDFEVKGYNIAVEAFADQRLKRKHYSLLFVGSPEGKQDEVRERLLNFGIDRKQLTVREFVKSREKMKELFCEVDMVIMPSKSEGFSLVALEALSAGLPILVGSNSGFARAIEDIPFGSYSVVDSEDPSKWAECVQGVRDKYRVLLHENKMLREFYSKMYCWKTQCEELVDRLWKMVFGSHDSVSFKLGTLSLDDVHGIADELSSSWKMVGRVLNLPDAVIDQIEANKSDDFEKCFSILRRWQEMYPSDATYHVLACALQHPTVDRVDLAAKYCGLQFDEDVAAAAKDADSSVPAEIRGRGKVKVYRGRIMLLGQDRAGKTSLRKSLLGLPFDPEQESTVGVEVDEVKNWMLRKKGEVSELKDEIVRFIVRYLNKPEADDNDSTYPNVEEVKTTVQLKEKEDHEEPKLSPDEDKPATDTEEIEGGHQALTEENLVDKNEVSNELELNINLNVTDLVVRSLQSRPEDDIKSEEVILTLWDFAGQHLYYASHSVFLSGRAVYILVYNLNKDLLATAEPCARQGLNKVLLENPNDETNLDNLLSWLVSVHNIRSAANKNVAHQGKKLSYLQPPVIIVGTNLDQPFKEVKTTEKDIKDSMLDKEYAKHVVSFFAVDNKMENDEGVQELRQRIMEILKEEPYMGKELPLRWFKFERAVDGLVAKQTYFMDLDQLLPVIRQVCHIEDEEEVTTMLNFYHDLGVIVKHGGTVVLQVQWLIDLFKQLITVRPFDEANPLYLNCWRDLEKNGILRKDLVDHVFSNFVNKDPLKQDILDMMEEHGLIAKFSIATDENQHEQRYFVPTQLRSSPLALYEIKPSESDPCPLVLHFLDGFVPHGLFPQLVSKFIHWCSENGFKKTPQLFNNGARLFIGKQITFALILICRKRFIKIVLKTRNPSSSKSLSMNASNKMAIEVRNFIEGTLDGFSRDLSYLSNLRYEFSVVCTHCQQRESDLDGLLSCCHDDRLHLLQVCPGEELICMENFSDETVKVPGWEMWFEVSHSQTMEPEEDTQIADDLAESVSFRPEAVSEDDVLLIAHELGPLWKKVGLVLKVPKAVISQIEANKSEVFEKCHTVLTTWQERFPYDATYPCLARALKHPAVGREDLAAKYCGLQFASDEEEHDVDEGEESSEEEEEEEIEEEEIEEEEEEEEEEYQQQERKPTLIKKRRKTERASDVKEGKIDKKAIDEDGKRYGGNAEREDREEPDKVAIFEGRVTSNGFHLDLSVGGIHLTFPPDTVAEPTGIMIYRWKYGACLPQLNEHEAVVSDVIEISAATEDGGLTFNSEVKLVLSHSAADLEGYELVLKRLADTEKNEWEEIAGCIDIRHGADIDDYPCPNNVPYSFLVVLAGIIKCSTYAVVSRLKLSPTFTITVSGGTFVHPNYPEVTITVPQKAVTTETRLSLELGVQEVPQDEFQDHGLFCGPILRLLCSSRATFLKPVTIQLPVSLGNKLVNIPQPAECRVRIFFLSSERETKEWVEISDKLENPASYDGKLVKFKVQHFSGFAFVFGTEAAVAAAVAVGAVGMYLLWKVLIRPRVADFFAYFDPKKRLGSKDILFLICCPAHQREKEKHELEKAGLTPYYDVVTSNIKIIPGHDRAFVFVSGGINFASSEDMAGGFYLSFHGNKSHRGQLQVRLISDKVYCRVQFRKTPDTKDNKNLLSTVNLPFSSSIDRQTKGPKEDISEGVGLDESGSIKPGTVSEDDVILIAHELGHLWKKGGQVLKVPKAVIDQIEANKSEVSDKCYGSLFHAHLKCWEALDVLNLDGHKEASDVLQEARHSLGKVQGKTATNFKLIKGLYFYIEGEIYCKTKDFKKALQSLDVCLYYIEELPEVHIQLVRCYNAMGNCYFMQSGRSELPVGSCKCLYVF
ncbi:uncharacterized protein LOC141879794 isoform X5 [Acropora palmata]|uniref:uncharacterized protein LOC141879794 isoform X5 n=1 Tax=Acropora palmata TaxID=6131 RepID=UPI003DA08DE1